MYGRIYAMWPMSEVMEWPSEENRSHALRKPVLASSADVPTEHLESTESVAPQEPVTSNHGSIVCA